jgi:hypothetical protein
MGKMIRVQVMTLFSIVAISLSLRAEAPTEISFDRDVRPILSSRCYACHGPDEEHREGGLRLDIRDRALAPLDSGEPAIVPGKVEESALMARVRSTDEAMRMPPVGKDSPLTPAELEILRRWIEQGAEYSPHWSFVAPKEQNLPMPIDPWCQNRGDAFIFGRLSKEGMSPSPPADRSILLRRLALDLTGLPPTREESQAFAQDPSSDAVERWVDRYLASPALGERWARVWLDLARYADSTGYASDPLRPTIWRYRDWVISSLNENKPFDEFTIEQMAGDLLPRASTDQIVATSFHRNTMTNTEGGTDDEEYRVAAVKDRINTTMQVWMGLTAGCAQCHSHKYDPITHEEYYRLYAFFNQTADTDKPDDEPTMLAPTATMRDEIAVIDRQIADLRGKLSIDPVELARQQSEWEKSLAMTTDWQPMDIESFRSQAGVSLEKLDDGSIRANDAKGTDEVYEVEGTLASGGWTGLRLEVMADRMLPLGGPGRASNGGFVLSRITADIADPSTFDQPVRGKYVRIELPGADRILSLAEVEVFAAGENIARGGKPSQVSTDFGGEAGRAIDGVTDGDYFAANSVTHTATQADPWWEVEWSKPTAIERIVVWNRTDGSVGSRLAGGVVTILDERRQVVWSQVMGGAPAPAAEFTPGPWRNASIVSAWATFEQQGLPVIHAVRPANIKQNGWGISPKYSQSQTAWFVFQQPTPTFSQTRWRVRLEHFFTQPNHTIGRFRLAVTRDPAMVRRAVVPKDVLDIIDRPAVARSADELARLSGYFQQIAPSLATVREEIAKLESSKPTGPKIPVLREVPPSERRPTRVLAKGNFLSPGAEVQPSVPAALHPLPGGLLPDRIALAKWLVDRGNPLTARVLVNRLWGRLFGRGIVETEEDFGTQGSLPVQPELLDDLAVDFMERGWDLKRTMAEIVTSATYRQSSAVRLTDMEKDPANQLLSRYPRQRLDAETVRDQALSLAGELSTKMMGPSVFPYQPAGLWQAAFNGSDRLWSTSPGEDRVRRGLYTFWRRTIPYPSMAVFDAPSREICTLRRPSTNTPLQAFVTWNDPVYVEASQNLGRRLAREAGHRTVDRVRLGLELVLGRPADEASVESLRRLYEDELSLFRRDLSRSLLMGTEPAGPLPPGMEPAEGAALSVLGNVLLNLDGVLTKG